jgi:hypothetical protein
MIFKVTQDNIQLITGYFLSEGYECEDYANETSNCVAIHYDKTFAFHSHEHVETYGSESILIHAALLVKIEKELVKLRDEVEEITNEMRMDADENMNPWYYIDQLKAATDDI